MPRTADPNRDQAKKMYLDSGGQMNLKDIADKLGISDGTVRGWKSRYKWDNDLNVTLQKDECNATNKRNVAKKKGGAPKGNKNALGNSGGAPPGNRNAVGNRGGHGGPERNNKAVTHGLFRKFLPDDESYLEIYNAAGETNPLDMLWTQIQINFANIIHAQKVMFVTDKDEMIKELKKKKVTFFGGEDGGSADETEWEFQFAWDRQATALNSQARAMGQLTSMIRQYEEMCRNWDDEERSLRVKKMKVDIEKVKVEIENIKGGGKRQEAEDWASAIEVAAERRRAVKVDAE